MSRESRIGMFVFIGIVVIGLIGLFLNPIERLRDQYFRVDAVFDDAGGIRDESPVLYAGVCVGRVHSFEVKDGKAILTLQIKKKALIPKDCTVGTSSTGVVGDTYVKLSGGNPGAGYLQSGDVIYETKSDRTAQKTYIARLEGLLEGEECQQGSIALPIALHWFERPKQCVLPVSEGGREALTDYEVIGVEDTPEGLKSLVALHPRTGRTHQLRVHCAHPEGLGLPIDGDPFYGTRGLLEETREHRLCLHAASLRITHPMTGRPLEITAPFDFPTF